MLKLIAVLILTQTLSLVAFAGDETAHGGAGVICTQPAVNPLNGFYMLDFVIMRGGPGDRVWPYPAEFSTVTNYNQILDWISNQIQNKLPVMAKGLANFRSTVFTNTPGNAQRWFPVQHLRRIWDQGLGVQPLESDEEVNFRSDVLPTNCRFGNIRQVVVKYPAVGYTAFAYIPERVDALSRSGPLQVSYLVVHEWLRNYTNDAEVIRRSTRLLHSTAVQDLSQPQLQWMLHNFGLF